MIYGLYPEMIAQCMHGAKEMADKTQLNAMPTWAKKLICG